MLRKYISSKQDYEIKGYALCLGNISNDFTINKMEKKKKKTGLQGVVKFFLLILILLVLTIF